MKQGWINRAIATYGRGRWYVSADADEHLVFDGAGPRTLRDLVAFAERRGLSRVRGMLVDMYGPGPVLAPRPPRRSPRPSRSSTAMATPRASASSGSRATAAPGGAASPPAARCSRRS